MIISQVEHKLWGLTSAGQYGNKVGVPDIRYPSVSYDSVSLLRHKVVNQALELGLGGRRRRLQVHHYHVSGKAVPQTTEVDNGLLFVNPSADSKCLGHQLVPIQADRLLELSTPDMFGCHSEVCDGIHHQLSRPYHIGVKDFFLGRVRWRLRAIVQEAIHISINPRSCGG